MTIIDTVVREMGKFRQDYPATTAYIAVVVTIILVLELILLVK